MLGSTEQYSQVRDLVGQYQDMKSKVEENGMATILTVSWVCMYSIHMSCNTHNAHTHTYKCAQPHPYEHTLPVKLYSHTCNHAHTVQKADFVHSNCFKPMTAGHHPESSGPPQVPHSREEGNQFHMHGTGSHSDSQQPPGTRGQVQRTPMTWSSVSTWT